MASLAVMTFLLSRYANDAGPDLDIAPEAAKPPAVSTVGSTSFPATSLASDREEDVRTIPRTEISAGSDHTEQTTPTSGTSKLTWPTEYSGVRHESMVQLYVAFKSALEAVSKRMQAQPDDPMTAEAFWRYSAYLDLIQSQRLYALDFGGGGLQRPANSGDVQYHQTGMGDMQVVFELRRADYPEFFKADALREEMLRAR